MKQFILLGILCNCLLAGCAKEEEPVAIPDDFTELESNFTEMEVAGETTTITIGMIGDILLHKPLYQYDNYNHSFKAVKDRMMETDFVLANQESLPGGVELGLSGYPRFNSPKHIVRDLKENGVDLLTIANNHVLDQGESGLLKAIYHMKEFGMPYAGAYESAEDRNTMRIFEVGGIRIGVLAYTSSLNGLAVPKGKGYLVSFINKSEMETDIRKMKEACDLLVVSVHWGEEYMLQPSSRQDELAEWLAAEGVDIIFGHHPHVLQPYREIGHTKVFYSLGNFFSAQQFDTTNVGGIARVEVSKTEVAGKRYTQVGRASFFPTAVIRDEERKFVVVPLEEAKGLALTPGWVEEHVGLPKDNKK